jgi:WD40 repeat protein
MVDAQTGQRRWHLRIPHPRQLSGLALSPDGQVVAAGTFDGAVWLIDGTSGQELKVLEGAGQPVHSLVFSPDGRTLAVSVFGQPSIALWDVRPAGDAGPMPQPPPPENPKPPAQGPAPRRLAQFQGAYGPGPIAYSSDGRTLYARFQGILRLDAQTGKERQPNPVIVPDAYTFVLSGDGKVLVTINGTESAVRVRNPQTGELIRTLEGHTAKVTSLAVNADGQTVVSLGDSTVRVWDADTGKERLTLDQPPQETANLAVSPDGKWVALIGRKNPTVELVDTTGGRPREKLLIPPEFSPAYVAFSPDGKALALGDRLGGVQLWDLETRQRRWTLAFKVQQQQGLFFSADGQQLAALETDFVRLIDWRKGQEIRALPHPGTTLFYLAFSPDGKTLAAANWGPVVYAWDLTEPNP